MKGDMRPDGYWELLQTEYLGGHREPNNDGLEVYRLRELPRAIRMPAGDLSAIIRANNDDRIRITWRGLRYRSQAWRRRGDYFVAALRVV